MSGYARATGDTLAGYRIDELVGRGGMGEVFRAYDVRLDRTVALKLLAPRARRGRALPRAIPPRVAAGGGLDHPNVVPIFEAGEVDGRLYIAMRLSTAPTWRALGEEGARARTARSALLTPIADALDAAACTRAWSTATSSPRTSWSRPGGDRPSTCTSRTSV